MKFQNSIIALSLLMGCTENKDTADSPDTSEEVEYNEDERTDLDGDGWSVEDGDCDDDDRDIYPGAEELCNDIDDNCNSQVDEGYGDSDEDGIADCLDEEECDGIDNDGDGEVDNDFDDTDGDGIADCVDEEECDGLDNNGDGLIDEGFDLDGDGYFSCHYQQLDCDDENADVNPGALEDDSDEIDNDCDGLVDENDSAIMVGSVVITEIMNNPISVSDIYGEWFEIHNVSGTDLTINGMVLSDLDGSESHQISGADPIILESGAFMILGNSADVSENGGIDVDYAYSGISLGNESDGLQISFGYMTLDVVSWDNGLTMPDVNGLSMQLDPHFMSSGLNDDGQYWCGVDEPTPGGINPTCEWVDHDGDGLLASEGDCDDYDASSTNESIDGDCDTIVTPLDCDDSNPISTIVATDADCDNVLTADDCDDTDDSLLAFANDQDCDGIIMSEDCDDSDDTSTAIADDNDCDGVLTVDDCIDTDPASTVIADDNDCDTVLTADDCDDSNVSLGAISLDNDCDMALSVDDCDDNNPMLGDQSLDNDCDMLLTADDCDDNDSTSTAVADDADCDGVATSDDCNDNDPASTNIFIDADCDSVLTADDCDDNNAMLLAIANDADCDSIVTSDDCDDLDPSSTAVANDGDCDGILTADDCDDADSGSFAIANDADCDDADTVNDCDDNDPSLGLQSLDMDCDGHVTADDCNDSDAAIGAISDDGDCDGFPTLTDCDDSLSSAFDNNGITADCAAVSCKDIYDRGYQLGNGIYWINPDGNGAFPAYCDMDNGGWTLAMRMTANNSVFTYNSLYWISTFNLNDANPSPTGLGDAKYQSYNVLTGTEIRGCLVDPNTGSDGCKSYDYGSSNTLLSLFANTPTGSDTNGSGGLYFNEPESESLEWLSIQGLDTTHLSSSTTDYVRVGINIDDDVSCFDARVRFGLAVNDQASIDSLKDTAGFGVSPAHTSACDLADSQDSQVSIGAGLASSVNITASGTIWVR